eukprot:CAMPEP_0206035190 /NCGR_PEP_ID=MMETSP1466-20131121/1903_1 /ASSEMBLY_ACC=CAM_ASM_001126 /TAXON_ID=44452 /ORGANISM="Pavlova gyrans, Strain CCMP608" /LENGTH=395 /DNA_ID=CAMNT_0053409543 /DNA_START=45 /DNA_END=1232 /DNA_ORIENTATION=-
MVPLRVLLVLAAIAAEASGYAVSSRSALHNSRVVKAAPRTEAKVCVMKVGTKAFVVGVAADSGCGKSTFMRRLTNIFGGKTELLDIGRETNTLVSDRTTVICLDDYHKYDRTGRKENKISALHKDCQLWDLMAEQVSALKSGDKVEKPIYNHITGELDPVEEISPTDIVIFEGLHPMLDDRVREMLDLSIYLDISDDIKFAWKIQRDMEERGHSLESIKASIEERKPDFEAFVAPQRAMADIVIEVLPTQISDDDTGKILRVRFIQKDGLDLIKAPFLFDEGSSIEWTPNKKKLTAEKVGCKFAYYPEKYMGNDVTVIEMDGAFDKLDELIYVESAITNTGAKFYGELTEQMLKNKDAVGADNGTGFFQTLCAFKIREAFEKGTGKEVPAVEKSK